MTALLPFLVERIGKTGPMTVADYMAECLLNPTFGYYATRDPFGARGDFITAPEISQLFGELVGLCLAQTWIDQGKPAAVTLAELGPGRGTLMADILRVTKNVPGFHAAAELHLVEASETLRSVQKATLSKYNINWHYSVAELPNTALYLVANEFFDALPIRQFIRTGDGWRERLIGLADGALAFGAGVSTTYRELEHRLGDTNEGDLVETCGQAQVISSEISSKIAQFGGVGIVIDYGDWHSLGDTFQAVRDHNAALVLSDPGNCDLTAHVDFEAIAKAAAGEVAYSISTQGLFLERLGITERARRLAKNMEPRALSDHIMAHRRLTHPDEMGTLFKAIALYPKATAPPPGFDP